MDRSLLEVAVHHARDVPGALAGGADRLVLVTPGADGLVEHGVGVSPEPGLLSAVVRAAGGAAGVPVRVPLRVDPGLGLSAGGLTRAAALAAEYLDLGAEGLVLGFLDADLEVDGASCRALLATLPDATPWTFHRGLDAALEPRRAWRQVLGLPGLDSVWSAGSPQGLEQGFDDLLALVRAEPAVAAVVVPAGGLTAEHVPWLARAGVHGFHLDAQVRPGGSGRAYVDADLVRSWRLLLDGSAGPR